MKKLLLLAVFAIFASCTSRYIRVMDVNDGKYIKWTSNVAAASAKADVNGTPTIFVNGKQLDRNTEYGDQAKFRAALAAGGVK